MYPQQVAVAMVLVKVAAVLQPVQVSKPMVEVPLQQNKEAAERH